MAVTVQNILQWTRVALWRGSTLTPLIVDMPSAFHVTGVKAARIKETLIRTSRDIRNSTDLSPVLIVCYNVSEQVKCYNLESRPHRTVYTEYIVATSQLSDVFVQKGGGLCHPLAVGQTQPMDQGGVVSA